MKIGTSEKWESETSQCFYVSAKCLGAAWCGEFETLIMPVILQPVGIRKHAWKSQLYLLYWFRPDLFVFMDLPLILFTSHSSSRVDVCFGTVTNLEWCCHLWFNTAGSFQVMILVMPRAGRVLFEYCSQKCFSRAWNSYFRLDLTSPTGWMKSWLGLCVPGCSLAQSLPEDPLSGVQYLNFKK